jgi:hypothetical protein
MDSRLAWNHRLTQRRGQLSLVAPVDGDTRSKSKQEFFAEAFIRNYHCRIVLCDLLRHQCVQIACRARFLYSDSADVEPALFSYFARPAKISELVNCVLCVFAVVGLQRMRLWGRWLAILLAGASVYYAIWFYSAILLFRMWTLVPHKLWPYVKNSIELGFGIYIVWYLLQPEVRHAFRPQRPSSVSESHANS